MRYKALVNFVGLISMSKGEVKAINDKELVADLVNAKYIEPIEKPKKTSSKGDENDFQSK